MSQGEKIVSISLEDEMKSAYIDYSMSVIVSRALPDVRDGLKPVHRRVLFGMSELGVSYNKAHKKSARIVGEVLGKYHPHGDTSVYDSMVRMAQPWSLRYPLVDGQGNFGSVDGDNPAAMRYTEARLQRISDDLLEDIDKETVDFRLNFDDSLEEPTVLPAKFPHLLVNGASGIAVGMATNMLPHNLTEVINGTIAYIKDNSITIEGLMEHVKAPDFPTGGTIYGIDGVREAFETGRGRVVVRGKSIIEETGGGKEAIIITEIPYQVNKSILIQKISALVNEKKIEGISEIRDESDRNGMRIVIEIKRDSMASVVLSKLYKYTPLQSSFGVNNIALVNGRPLQLNLKDLISEFTKFRIEVIVRRTTYLLKKAEEKAHILEGLIIAVDNIDEVIRIIRSSKNTEDARMSLMASFSLSEIQAKAILDMRLAKLTGLEIEKLREEYAEIQKQIEYYKSILASEDLQKQIIVEELEEIKERFGDSRKTDIKFAEGDISMEDLIADEDVVVTISHLGYIKRTKANEYRSQARGGKGSKGSKVRDEDYIEHLFLATNHDYLLLFTEQGRCFWLKTYEIPEANKTSSGRVLQNIIQIPKDDKVKAYIKIKDINDKEYIENNYIVFATKNGTIKKTLVESFSRPRTNGINAITIIEGDQLIEAKLTNGKCDILLGIKSGRAIRFPESTVRAMGRSAAGVRGISLDNEKDEVIGMITVDPTDESQSILVLTEKGMGKRSEIDEYRITNRGGKGVKTVSVTQKTGPLLALKSVTDENDLMITTRNGIMIRLAVDNLRLMGRATQGVKLINIQDQDEISDVAVAPKEIEPIIEDSEDLNLEIDNITEDAEGNE